MERMAIGKLPDAELEGGEDGIFAEINITPLTDVFLVMLIVFMVTAATALHEKKREIERMQEEDVAEQRSGLKVNLPSGETQEIDPVASSLVVAILPSGEVYVNNEAVDETQLDNIFRTAFAKDKNTQVVLKADAGVNHGRVVGVMERAKRVGLTKLAIATSGG
jgi:biopolymer transport protein ExbD